LALDHGPAPTAIAIQAERAAGLVEERQRTLLPLEAALRPAPPRLDHPVVGTQERARLASERLRRRGRQALTRAVSAAATVTDGRVVQLPGQETHQAAGMMEIGPHSGQLTLPALRHPAH